MRTIGFTGRFKRDWKREKRTDPKLDQLLLPVIDLILADVELPQKLFDHALTGGWKGFRDCHIKPDLVLIYEKRGAHTWPGPFGIT